MFISLLLTMKISNNNGGGSRFFILMYVSACNSSFSSFCLNSSAALSGRLNVTVTVEFKRYLLAVYFFLQIFISTSRDTDLVCRVIC